MKTFVLFVLALSAISCIHAQPTRPVRGESSIPACNEPIPPRIRLINHWQTILENMQKNSAENHQYALDQGAEFFPALNGRTLYLRWFPEDATEKTPVIVALHDRGSYAVDQFALWHEYAAEKGYGIVAPQWWTGIASETEQDYLLADVLYPAITGVLCAEKTVPGHVLLHGFNASPIYDLSVIDRVRQNNFFGLAVASISENNLLPEVTVEDAGEKPLETTNWLLLCPEQENCSALEDIQTWIVNSGGMLKEAEKLEAVLEVFEETFEGSDK